MTSQDIYTYAPHEHQLDEPFKGKGLGGMVNGNAGACIDNHHYLWLGLTAGLCRIDLEQVRQGNTAYRLWPGKLDASGSPLKDRVCFVSNATKDRILVGTNGNGFYIGTRQSNGGIQIRALLRTGRTRQQQRQGHHRRPARQHLDFHLVRIVLLRPQRKDFP